MKNKILVLTLLSILAFWILTVVIPIKLGQMVYSFTTSTEAKLYGLKEQSIDIGEMVMSIHTNDLVNRPTILMLHGFSSDKHIWSRFAKNFTNDYNVVIPDMAGHGDTGFSKNWSYKASDQVNRLIKLLDQLKIKKVHVIGNSMGGFFTAHFAKMYPNRILTAGLIDPAGVTSPQKSDMEMMLVEGRNPFEVNTREEFDEFYAMTMNKPPFVPSFVLDAVTEKYKQRKTQLTQIFLDFHGRDLLNESLNEIKVPTLLLWGEKDRLIHVSSVEVWKKGIKNIQVKTWTNIGHMPMIEIPNESSAVYREFLEKTFKKSHLETI